jgi:hypothetical protein
MLYVSSTQKGAAAEAEIATAAIRLGADSATISLRLGANTEQPGPPRTLGERLSAGDYDRPTVGLMPS